MMLDFIAMFDKAVDGVVAQGRRSVNGIGTCLYRGPNGLKCAIGHIIPDEMYVREMDPPPELPGVVEDYGTRINRLKIFEMLGLADDPEIENIFYRLQKAHDNSGEDDGDMDLFRRRASELRYRLEAHLEK